jgi:hypothetical protein
VNSRHARDFLVACAACDPAGDYAARQELVAAQAEPGAEWEGAVRGGDAFEVKVARRSAAPARGPAARRFSAADFAEPVASALKTFDALAPIAEVRRERGAAGWTLVLAKPLPWPLFLRCDVSAAFAPRAAQLSLILRDARVIALDFDGEALWARFVG